MILAKIYKNSQNELVGFALSGHAGFARSGKDVVCAAVSALAINTVNSIERLTVNRIAYEQAEDGKLRFRFTGASDRDGQVLMQSFVLGLQGIAEEYGDKYLTLHYKEV